MSSVEEDVRLSEDDEGDEGDHSGNEGEEKEEKKQATPAPTPAGAYGDPTALRELERLDGLSADFNNVFNWRSLIPLVRSLVVQIDENKKTFETALAKQADDHKADLAAAAKHARGELEAEMERLRAKQAELSAHVESSLTAAHTKAGDEVAKHTELIRTTSTNQNEKIKSLTTAMDTKQDQADLMVRLSGKADKSDLARDVKEIKSKLTRVSKEDKERKEDLWAKFDRQVRKMRVKIDELELNGVGVGVGVSGGGGGGDDDDDDDDVPKKTLSQELSDRLQSLEMALGRAQQKFHERQVTMESTLTTFKNRGNETRLICENVKQLLANKASGLDVAQIKADLANCSTEKFVYDMNHKLETKLEIERKQTKLDILEAEEQFSKAAENLQKTSHAQLLGLHQKVTELEKTSNTKASRQGVTQLAAQVMEMAKELRNTCSRDYCEEYCDETVAISRQAVKLLEQELAQCRDHVLELQALAMERRRPKESSRKAGSRRATAGTRTWGGSSSSSSSKSGPSRGYAKDARPRSANPHGQHSLQPHHQQQQQPQSHLSQRPSSASLSRGGYRQGNYRDGPPRREGREEMKEGREARGAPTPAPLAVVTPAALKHSAASGNGNGNGNGNEDDSRAKQRARKRREEQVWSEEKESAMVQQREGNMNMVEGAPNPNSSPTNMNATLKAKKLELFKDDRPREGIASPSNAGGAQVYGGGYNMAMGQGEEGDSKRWRL